MSEHVPTDTLPLFSQPYGGRPPFVKGSETSEEASDKLTSAESGREQVKQWLLKRGAHGSTDEETDLELKPESTLRPRRCELLAAGVVKDSGKKRMSSHGRRVTVWVLA